MINSRTVIGGLAALSQLFLPLSLPAQSSQPPSVAAPAGDVQRAGHLGRTIGDIERMIHFYHDLLGNGLLAERDQTFSFFSTQALTDFVSSPEEAEYRAVNMPVPGTSVQPGTVPELVVEVIEFRNIDRHQYMPGLQDPGVSNLTLALRDLDKTVARLKEAGVLVVTEGGEPVDVPTIPGIVGESRAIMVRDPDGYPVELIQITPQPETNAPADSNIIGAHVSLVVEDIDQAQEFYRTLIGRDLKTWKDHAYRKNEGMNKLRNTPDAEYLLGTMLVPGTNSIFKFIQYRGIDRTPYRPKIQDIGVAHVGFMVNDIEVMMERLSGMGVSTLGRNGGWYYLNPQTRALYTQDPNGFFVEVMERKENQEN